MARPPKHYARSDDLAEWGAKLQRLRTARGLAPKDAAKKTEVPKSTLSAYERGTVEIGLERLLKVVRAYDASLLLQTRDRWDFAKEAVKAIGMTGELAAAVIDIIEGDRHRRARPPDRRRAV